MNPPAAPERQLKSAAYHEAGHAAAVHARGLRLESVEVTPGAVWDGCCRRAAYDGTPETAGERDDNIMIALAGAEAEKLAGLYVADDSDERDRSTAVELACSGGTELDDVLALLARLEAEAHELLKVPSVWAGVERLAAELLRVGRVDGPDAHRVLAAP